MDTTTPAMISKYQVIRVLGRGGMGEVLLAQDDLGRRVAIKRPFASALADGLARFKLEARAATLTHPNIPVVYEMGTQADGLPFIAMEFVEGEPLDKLIASGKQIDLILKLSIVEQICAGLGYAHEKNIIHRDVKPANIIVQPNGVAKIIDFGIAKITNVEMTAELTQSSQIIGSLHYIAPERFKAEAIDGRVDIFSAGVILYLLLTGTLPFAGGETTASYRIVNEAHNALSEHIKDYPKALDGIMDRALAKNPEDRFSTAEDFADAIRDVIDDLKQTKVSQLFNDAERLTMESRYDPALELLDEAIKLEPANTQVRKLRRMVRDHQERRRRQDRLREFIAKAESLIAIENYPDALAQLKEALPLDSSSTELRDRIAFVEKKKDLYDRSLAALTAAEAARNRGDITAALRIAERAVQDDPENTKLLAIRGAIAKQLEREAMQARVVAILDSAQAEFSRKDFTAVETLLAEAAAIDNSHPKIEELRAELARNRDLDVRRQLMDEVQRRVNDFLRGDNYEMAADLLNRAIEKLPSETTLHRLKMDVDTAARKFDSQRFIEEAISSARQTFASNPPKALLNLRNAIDQMPGEERLISYERTLRQQYDKLLKQQILSDTLRNAREFLSNRHPEKAVDLLEAYQLEHGGQTELDELLNLARQEQRGQERRSLIESASVKVRGLVDDYRFAEAIEILESVLASPAVQNSGDKTLPNLLEDVRQQQQQAIQKTEVVRKRAVMLRERGQLDEALRVLKQHLATSPNSAPAQDLLRAIQSQWEIQQVTMQAVTAAAQASQQANFAAACESLQAVVRAYGESEELTRANQQVLAARSVHAQEIVSQSIVTSRAALMRKDVNGALDALRAANEMLEFADSAKQADWRRIAQAAKKAQSEPVAEGVAIADPLAEVDEAVSVRKNSSPVVLISGIAVACVALAGVGVLVFRKTPPTPPPPPTVETVIEITKAPPGAVVSIDGVAKKSTDATGSATIPVAPGDHAVEVTKDGFEPFTDKFLVKAGLNREPATLTPPPQKPGFLSMQSNLAGFKVIVDGIPRGVYPKKEGTLKLEEGEHTVRYTNEDGTDSFPDHKVVIAGGKTIPDAFSLKAPIPPKVETGGVLIQTTPNAQVSIDGRSRGAADGNGKLPVNPLPIGNHTVDISLDKYQPVSGRSITVSANTVAPLNQPLTLLPPPPPSSGSLTIATNPGAQVSINNGQRRGTADGSGQVNLDGMAAGSYQVEISLDKYQTQQVSASIRAGSSTVLSAKLQPVPEAVVVKTPPPPPPPVEKPKPVDTTAADIQGIKEALGNFEQAFKSKNMARIQANWLDMNADTRKSLTATFSVVDVKQFNENCQGQPEIDGASAKQSCMEISQFTDQDKRTSKKEITFSKINGKWVMKDKR